MFVGELCDKHQWQEEHIKISRKMAWPFRSLHFPPFLILNRHCQPDRILLALIIVSAKDPKNRNQESCRM